MYLMQGTALCVVWYASCEFDSCLIFLFPSWNTVHNYCKILVMDRGYPLLRDILPVLTYTSYWFCLSSVVLLE